MTIHFGNPLPAAVSNAALATTQGGVPAAGPATPAAPPAPPAPVIDTQDGVKLQLPPDQRKCADFDPTSGICKDTPVSPKTRDEVAASLKTLGIPEKDIQGTLDYLDQQGADYGEIGTLISNQLSFKRDGNDVLGAVQSYGVMLEGRAMKIPGTDTAHYKEVMAGLKDGRVHVDKDSARTDMDTAEGHYRFDGDTVDLSPRFKLDSAYSRSFLFHELVHTEQDVAHEHERMDQKPTFGDAELEAYKAQAAFLVKHGYKPDQAEIKGHKILNQAIMYVRYDNAEKQERAKPQPDQKKLEAYRERKQHYSEETDYEIRGVYRTVDLTLTANGLHSHHH